MFETIANNFITYMQQFPLIVNYSIAIRVLREFLKYLQGIPHQKPSKEEIKTTIDVIKEIEKSFAQSEETKQQIDNYCEFVKEIVDWGYKA